MNIEAQQERRSCQRFDLHLPVQVRLIRNDQAGGAFTQNLSIRGMLLYTNLRLDQGYEVELVMQMPSEITLSESMRVRCCGRVLRVASVGDRSVAAVQVEKYEFLPQADEGSPQFSRISCLHQHTHQAAGETTLPRSSPRPLFRP